MSLGPNETIDQAEEQLEKALHKKQDCSGHEQYCDPALNEFHSVIEAKHLKILDQVLVEISDEVKRNVHSKDQW